MNNNTQYIRLNFPKVHQYGMFSYISLQWRWYGRHVATNHDASTRSVQYFFGGIES